MKTSKNTRKEVIETVAGDIPRLGRPRIVRKEGEEILGNGLFARQWKWIQREAPNNQQLAAQYLRWLVDIHIASIEASRTSPKELEEQLSKRKSNHNKE